VTPVAEAKHYKARGTALAAWSDRSPELLLSGPAGTGKSRACLEKLHACALRFPGMRGLIVRKTRESLNESALVTYEEQVLPTGSPIAAGARRNTRSSYRYPNGSEIIVGGLKQSGRDQKQKIMSTEYDIAYVQEAIELTEEEWENITTRLRNGVMPFQQIIGDTNPDSPTHWIKQREKKGRLKVYESTHEENPRYFAADGTPTEQGKAYIAKLDALTGVRYERLRKGKWVQAEGVVYPGWDRNVHLIDRFPIPASWRRVRSIDFGYTNPFVCQWWAIDHDNRMYLDREIYRTRRTVKVHARQIREVDAGAAISYTVADHDAEDRATLRECKIPTLAARKAILPGVNAVTERLKVAGDGKPRLFVFRDSLVEADELLMEAKRPLSTVDEFDSYVWPKGQDGKALKEVPVDDNNHGMDAMRYAVMSVDRRQAPDEPPMPDDAEAKAEADEERRVEGLWTNPGVWT
jgi:phage terminase large subunit